MDLKQLGYFVTEPQRALRTLAVVEHFPMGHLAHFQQRYRCFPLGAEPMMAVALPPLLPASSDPIPLSALCGKPLIYYRRWEQVLEDAFACRVAAARCSKNIPAMVEK